MTTGPTNEPPGDTGDQPPSRRRVLLYAAAPVALLILLMTGVRFANEAARTMEAGQEEKERIELRALRPTDPASRPTPIPVITRAADQETKSALESVVRGQLRAIQEQDFEKALTYAIPGMRSGAQAHDFGNMIRARYSPMLAAKSVTVLSAKIQERPGAVRQALVDTQILTEEGGTVRYGYMLILVSEGWRVIGVVPDRGQQSNREENLPSAPRLLPQETAHAL